MELENNPGKPDPADFKVITGPNGEERRSGTLKWWHSKRRFGFVIVNDSGEEAFVHYTQIKTFPKRIDEGQTCKLTLTKNDKGKLTAVDVHVDGCELVDAEGWQKKKKQRAVDHSKLPPAFDFKIRADSTMDCKQQLEAYLKDFSMKLVSWMSSWHLKSKVQKESHTICKMLREHMIKALQDPGAESPEFSEVISNMSNVIKDQLLKRKKARLIVSAKQAHKQKRIDKAQRKLEEKKNPGETSAFSSSGGTAEDDMKGLEALGPVEALRKILIKFGPLQTKEMSQIYQKVTGQGFKKTVGSSLNHVLRENASLFKLGYDKRWSYTS